MTPITIREQAEQGPSSPCSRSHMWKAAPRISLMSVVRRAQFFPILSTDGAHFKHPSSGAAKAFLSIREAEFCLLIII